MTREEIIDRMLLDYAAGGLCAEETLVVAALMALDARARMEVARYEALGGRVIEEEKPSSVRCLDAVMKCIEQATAPPPREAPRMPAPLAALLGGCTRDDSACWLSACSGVERVEVKLCGGEASSENNARARSENNPRARKVFLMRLAPRAALTAHAHGGPEITLVLEGEYSDAYGRYAKGDIAVIADAHAVHSPRAGDGGCVCLVMTHGPLRFVNPVRRFIAFFRGA